MRGFRSVCTDLCRRMPIPTPFELMRRIMNLNTLHAVVMTSFVDVYISFVRTFVRVTCSISMFSFNA